jgi:lysophospholipid hydrolase
MQRVVLRGAQCAFRSGQTAAEMFIISSGRLRMLETSQRDGRVIEAGRGECIGETSLCAGLTVHSSTFVCVRDTEMIKLSTAAFRFLVNAQPQALIKLSGVMAKRLALLSRTNAGPSRAPSFTSPAELDSFVNASKSTAGSGRFANVSTITIVPTSALVDSAAFTATLSTALSAHGRVKIIDFDAVLKNLAISDNAEGAQLLDQFYYRSRCAAWLTELEQEYRYLLLIANHDEHSGWSRCALRQADVVLLVAEDSQDPVPSVCENTLVWHKSGTAASFPAPQQAAPISAPSSSTPLSRTSLQLIELVIVHDDDLPLPSGTRRFLDSRPSHLHQHHHLRRGTPTDFARLARYLCGRSVGLVLSGGGARGLAHLGVIKAMNEQGIPIDFIGGTSQV